MKKTSRAFTLIEVLLGLMIFSIIGLTLYNMFWMGMKIDDKANSINRSFQEARIALDIIAKDVENTFAYDFSASYPEQISFKGLSDQMTLLAVNDQGIKSVHYYLGLPNWGKITQVIVAQHVKGLRKSSDAIPIRFLMRQEVYLPEYLSGKKSDSEGEMIAAVKASGLKISYGFIKKENGKKLSSNLTWIDSWQEASLPDAVRVEMTLFDPENPNREPVLRRDIYLNSFE